MKEAYYEKVLITVTKTSSKTQTGVIAILAREGLTSETKRHKNPQYMIGVIIQSTNGLVSKPKGEKLPKCIYKIGNVKNCAERVVERSPAKTFAKERTHFSNTGARISIPNDAQNDN